MKTNTYTLKVAGIEAQKQLKDLWEESFRQAYTDVHSPENIESYCSENFTDKEALKFLEDPQTVCTLASLNGLKVGLSVVKHHDCPIELEASASELKQLYILASEYGTGLGKILIEDAFRIAKEAGNDRIWLCVSAINYRAQSFYSKFGFSKIGNGPTLKVGSDRLPSLIMSLKL